MSVQLSAQPNLYKIKEKLGESPVSVVYLAHRFDKILKLNQPVVLKVFKNTSDLPLLQMESLLRARHSGHLVKVLGFERLKDRPALILEYIKGLNLKQILQKSRLNLEEKYYICAGVLQGLEELKQKNLVHGDLSFSNILIDTKGQVHLTDYGLANYAGQCVYSTRPFTAPELLQREQVGSFQSDLFSLGVLEKILMGELSEEEWGAMENTHFFVKGDPLLDPLPQNRRRKAFCFSQDTGLSLGGKVSDLMSFKNYLSVSVPLPFFQKKTKKDFFSFRKTTAGLLFFIFLFIDSPFSFFPQADLVQNSKVLIRSKKWMYVQMLGASGYAPLAVEVEQPGTYRIKWKNQYSQGVKNVHIRAGQLVVLRDHDFP